MEFLQEIKDEKALICALNIVDKCLISGSFQSLKIYNIHDFSLVKTVPVPGRMVYSIVPYSNYIFIANDNSIYVSFSS